MYLQVSLAIKQLQRGDAKAFMGIFKPASVEAVCAGGDLLQPGWHASVVVDQIGPFGVPPG